MTSRAPDTIRKYPRTPHLEGSRLQPGDEDLAAVPLNALRGRYVVVEEKLDGANTGLSLGPDGRPLLQSRGHYLTGGPRERHWDLCKRWAAAHADTLVTVLGLGVVIYGEWLYAKHTVFYDCLPHYFLEFDILAAQEGPAGTFLSTARRRELLNRVPCLRSVPVLWEGRLDEPADLLALVQPSLYKSARWREHLQAAAAASGVDPTRAAQETDPAEESEGLYIKVEEDGRVVERYKWVRASFLTRVCDSGSHWLARPIIPNGLAPGVDLFAPCPRGGETG
jgi:hypothetical protein